MRRMHVNGFAPPPIEIYATLHTAEMYGPVHFCTGGQWRDRWRFVLAGRRSATTLPMPPTRQSCLAAIPQRSLHSWKATLRGLQTETA